MSTLTDEHGMSYEYDESVDLYMDDDGINADAAPPVKPCDVEAEAQFILDNIRLYAGHIRAFLAPMDSPALIAVLGYIVGLTDAQAPALSEAFENVREVTRGVLWPYLQKHTPEGSPVPDQVSLFFPASAIPQTFSPASKLIS